MYSVCLINMPFVDVSIPSLGLTQLQSVLRDHFSTELSVDIFYLNHDFANYFGFQLYQTLVTSFHNFNEVGGWFFRPLAFPEVADNTEEYFRRYYPGQDEETQRFKAIMLEKRRGVEAYLDTLIDQYGLDKANLVGFTSMFVQNIACFALARKLKMRNPALTTVLGGANAEYPMGLEIVKNVPQIDFVFSGPALKSLPQFVEHWLHGESDRCHRIHGVFSKQNLAAVGQQSISGKWGVLGEDLNVNTPIDLDYTSFLDSIEKHFPDRAVATNLLFETSRGCWWGEHSHCTFCGLNGSTMLYRAMAPENALALFDSLFKFVPRCKLFEGVDNILPMSYLDSVIPHLNTPPGVKILYEVKANLKQEQVAVLAKAGVTRIQPGIEALNTSTLTLMKKGSTAFTNLALLKYCALYGVSPEWHILMGFPGEAAAVYEKYVRDFSLLMHLPPPSEAYPVRFDRYSPYFIKATEYGLDLHPFDFYAIVYPFPQESLGNLAYFFTDHNFDAPYITATARWINKVNEQIERWQQCWPLDVPQLRANLFLKQTGHTTLVHDSRSGEVLEYPIDPHSKRVLNELAHRGVSLTTLAQRLGGSDGLSVEKEIEFLQTHGLLFEENGKFMSLVLPFAPTYYREPLLDRQVLQKISAIFSTTAATHPSEEEEYDEGALEL
ncbi:MAG: RiPP maturation radical SAM C-methyltransferase [Candidatus Competibacteraceae bacterium]